MEFMDGICKTRECAWDVLLSESMKDQEAIVEGAIHSIRNMGDVAFVILQKKEGLCKTVYENDKTNVSIHDLKEAMCVRLTGTLHEEERAPHGRELRISHVEILSSPAEPLPLAIDKWKRLVPDMSRLLPDMVKKQLPASTAAVTAAQAEALVQETCRAELVHGVSCLLGLSFLWLWRGWGGVIVLLVWVLLANLPFILIQRYNRPRLVRLAALLHKREQRKGEARARTDTDL